MIDKRKLDNDLLSVLGHRGCKDYDLVVSAHQLQELLHEGTQINLQFLLGVRSVDEGFIEIKHEGVTPWGGLGEVGGRASCEGAECCIVLIEKGFVVVEVNGIQLKQLIEAAINGHVSILKLIDENFDLLEQSGVALEDRKQLLMDEESG
jgi:hypothetical protein